jgi:hypothetical protein
MKLYKLIPLAAAVFVVGCGGGGLGSGGSRDAVLSSSDWVLPGNFFADRYILRATDDMTVTIEMDSNDFDTYLVVIDEDNNVLEDDDSGPGVNSRVSFQAFAGEELEVRATSHFSDDTGAYRLRWSRGLRYESELRGRGDNSENLAAPKVKEKARGTDLVKP